jgi:hypothetical protein
MTLLFGDALPAQAQIAPDHAEDGLHVIYSNEHETALRLVVSDFSVEPAADGGGQYRRLVIPQFGSTLMPGLPQVPMTGIIIGVPTVDGLELEILSEDYDVLEGIRLLPAPELRAGAQTLDDPAASNLTRQYAEDAAVYGADQSYPGRVVEVADSGFMGDQAVTQLRFYPVQYNPAKNEVRVYRRLVVRLSWPDQGATGSNQEPDLRPAYERLLQGTLANYSDLHRPPIRPETGEHKGVSSLETAEAVNSSSALKIGVMANGVFRLTYTDVVSAGFGLSGLNAHTLKLSNRGVEVPILVMGEDDGVFSPGDQILFYGTGISNDVYTEKNIYWLTAGGANGQRMATRMSQGGGSTPASFPETLHAESDSAYWQTMPDGAGQDHWFWYDRISPNSQGLPVWRDYPFQLHNILTGTASATLTVRLKGATSVLTIDPDHHTRLTLNGVQVASSTWDGFAVSDQVASFSDSLLKEGLNTLRVEALTTSAPVDHIYTNWLELNYRARYIAFNNQLLFHPPAAGQYHFSVSGFNTNQVSVFDVTNPASVVQITGISVSGSYQAQFGDAAQVNTSFLALTPARFLAPASLELDSTSNWRSTSHAADYILITPSQFYTATLALAQYRQNQGLRVAVVKVEDLYDEFNWGIFNPKAIRDFLSYAYVNWSRPAPEYVLLVGGASYDYRGKLADVDRVNYVPTQMIETFLLGETASDNWFVAVAGDDVLPDMFIGRLTAESVTEVNDLVTKIIAYDQHPPDASWNTRALFVAGEEASFASASDQLLSGFSAFLHVDKVYAGQYSGGASSTADISAAINAGRAFVNYLGHGDPGSWSGDIYQPSDIAALTNIQHFPIVTIGDCLNGFFVGKAKPSMAEEFLKRSDRGAVAVWAPTGLGFTSGHEALFENFYRAIILNGVPDLGAATTTAKLSLYADSGFWGELVETVVLFGDPATRVVVPHLQQLFLPTIEIEN